MSVMFVSLTNECPRDSLPARVPPSIPAECVSTSGRCSRITLFMTSARTTLSLRGQASHLPFLAQDDRLVVMRGLWTPPDAVAAPHVPPAIAGAPLGTIELVASLDQ